MGKLGEISSVCDCKKGEIEEIPRKYINRRRKEADEVPDCKMGGTSSASFFFKFSPEGEIPLSEKLLCPIPSQAPNLPQFQYN